MGDEHKSNQQSELSIYLSDYELDRHINSSQSIAVDLTTAFDEFDRLSHTEGCFIGFERNGGDILQFIWSGDDHLEADIPIAGRRASLVRQGAFEELRPLVAKFAGGTLIYDLPGFRFQNHEAP